MAQKLDADMIEDGVLSAKMDKSANLSDVADTPTAFANIKQAATESATGVVELATTAEAVTGTDTARAVTPAGVAAALAAAGSGFAGFHAHKNGTNQTGIATITWTKVTFGTEEFDEGSYYDAANSRFTPPAGKYLIRANIAWSAGIASGEQNRLALYKNGAEFKLSYRLFGGTGIQSNEIMAIVDADGDDYFEIFVYASGAGDKSLSGSAVATYFEATVLG